MAENKTPFVAMTLDELKNAAKELGKIGRAHV